MLKSFVPTADDVNPLQQGRGPEGEFFLTLAKQGHGGARPNITQQGHYCFTPSGEFLGADNTRDPERLMRLLKSALAKWEQLPAARKTQGGKETAKPKRAEAYYPKDGLVLRQYSRDLGKPKRALGDHENPFNTDFLWFTAEEVQALLPAATTGASKEMPANLVRRIVRLHMLDNVMGQANPFQDRHVNQAQLTLEVTQAGRDRVELRLVGQTSAGDKQRGIDAQLLGKATYSPSKRQFSTFELLAVGMRYGATKAPYIRNETGKGPIGYAFVLASDSPIDRVAPTYFPAYGWSR